MITKPVFAGIAGQASGGAIDACAGKQRRGATV
jgi:hypothetical protein